MSYSLNEIEAMAKRAARGAGLSWGLAEEAAKSARWLSSFDLPGPELLAALLDLNNRIPMTEVTPVSLSGIWSGRADRLCPVIVGATMCDYATRLKSEDITMRNVTYPLLVVPFAAVVALHLGTPVAVEWDGISLICDGHILCHHGTQEKFTTEYTAHLRCTTKTVLTTLATPIAPVNRAQVDTDCWDHLSAFAHRTYAPATESSRLLGAGTGHSDNS